MNQLNPIFITIHDELYQWSLYHIGWGKKSTMNSLINNNDGIVHIEYTIGSLVYGTEIYSVTVGSTTYYVRQSDIKVEMDNSDLKETLKEFLP